MRRGGFEGKRRIICAAGAVLLELGGLAALFAFLSTRAVGVYVALEAASGVALLILMGSAEDGAYKMAWMACGLVLGAPGVGLYLLFGRRRQSRFGRLACGNMAQAQRLLTRQAHGEEAEEGTLATRYLRACGFPAWTYTRTAYFPCGERFFEALFADMERAQERIEIEFFIFSAGTLLEKLLNICRKAHERGVVIRLLIDDAGTLLEKDKKMMEDVRAAGIEARVFNPIVRHAPLLTLNFRDHRKIVVIDGQIAYTGGMNLADEYANLRERYGYWKDTGVRLEGDAANSLRAFFEALWATAAGERLEALPDRRPCRGEGEGLVQPYQSGPQGARRNAALSLYKLMIAGARRRIWITTPYLLMDEATAGALCMAAQCGVDVRVVVPGVPDHAYVALAGEAHYPALLRSGVKIYRYTPGFIHAKMCVCDEGMACVGTVNFDFRSLYLHFEDGVLFSGAKCIEEIAGDIESVLGHSEQVTLESVEKASAMRRMGRAVLHTLSPMM